MAPRLRPLVTAVFVAAALAAAGCDNSDSPDDGLLVEELRVGVGREAVAGDSLRVTYAGAVKDSGTFESGEFTFVLGRGDILTGLDRGIAGMRPTGVRRITIPPALGYGATNLISGSGVVLVPAGATLVYRVELLANHPRR